MTYFQMFVELQKGKKATRKYWNGTGKFIFMIKSSEISVSLNDSNLQKIIAVNDGSVSFRDVICLYDPSSDVPNILFGWSPGTFATNSDDWYLLD